MDLYSKRKKNCNFKYSAFESQFFYFIYSTIFFRKDYLESEPSDTYLKSTVMDGIC